MEPEGLHLTLRFLGETNASDAQLDAVARAVRAAPFSLILDRAGGFPLRQPVGWLGCSRIPPPLLALWTELGRALSLFDIAYRPEPRYVPHVTIARNTPMVWSETTIRPLVWPVEDFVLVESHPDRAKRYEVIARWPLVASGEFDAL